MVKVVILHPDLYTSKKDDELLMSFTPDVIKIKYDLSMTKESVLTAIGNQIEDVTHFSFVYHYNGIEVLPFFKDKRTATLKPKYRYYSDTVIDIIQTIRDSRKDEVKVSPLIVDILTCDLNSTRYKEEVNKIETDLNINIRYSVDKIGNQQNGGNWVLESEKPTIVNVKDTYFTDDIYSWKNILLVLNLSEWIKANPTNQYISWNSDTNTFTVEQNIIWSDFLLIADGDSSSYIELIQGETFDGNGKTIDITGINTWEGLLQIVGTAFIGCPVVQNLGILGGKTNNSVGFITSDYVRFCKINNCYSTGEIAGDYSGGICGDYISVNEFGGGKVLIENCYSTGNIIGDGASGLTGSVAYGAGECDIIECYSLGEIIGTGAGGIIGGYSGYNSGKCSIINCYSIGNIIGNNSGGITGDYAGNNGTCIIENCYSTGSLSGLDAGCIVGANSGTPNTNNCTITNCVYNVGPIAGTASSIIDNETSTNLSDINGFLYTNWSTDIWKVGGEVVSISNFSLPILQGFQIFPWIFSESDPEFYSNASIAAQFSSLVPPSPIPVPIVSVEIPPCCQPNVCNANPQSSNYNSNVIINKKAGKAVGQSVDNFYKGVATGQRTAHSQPIFKSYYDYMNYLQGKYK